ncbi:MAG: metalloregulator ArsR/SmtB family transcription factor [Bacilli bacterium]|jgi:ArsR family transcriptional regulator|nr:metalloregulator ArsR/SmtB family transcription factor [Bacilli bacterium]
MENEYCLEDNGLSADNISTLQDEKAIKLAEFFKVFSDSTRLKILALLFQKRLCVHEIALLTNMSQSSISHQLKILRHFNLVKYEKEGKHIFYQLADNHVEMIFKNGINHLDE